ncbi:unnamed protein product [Durusdinium trenchii]|uniref:Uncharacterized protein n=2 Tax=Durusdinium trenchii TaxID=1381693 RepID=A0ABP0L869_9DINO
MYSAISFTENWDKWPELPKLWWRGHEAGVVGSLEPFLSLPTWSVQPAFSLWCGSWEHLQLIGEIYEAAELEQTIPSRLPTGEGLALFAPGTCPAREEIPHGGRWIVPASKAFLDQAWLALCHSLLEGLFNGSACVCGVTATLNDSEAKLSVWLLKAEDDMHVLAVGSVLMDLLQAKGHAPRLKFESFVRGKVTHRLRP